MKRKEKIFIKKKKHLKPVIPVIDKGNFPDFMRKEIFTQPQLIDNLCERYIHAGKIDFDYLKIKIDKIKRIYITGSGADYGCVLAGAYNFEVLADIPSEPALLSEFNFSNPVLDKNTLVIIISDTKDNEQCKEAIDRSLRSSAKVIGIFNYEPENPMAVSLNFMQNSTVSTAAYTLRYAALSLLALYFGEKNQVITELYVRIATKMLQSLKDKIKYVLENEYLIRRISEKLDSNNLILTGTNVDFAAAAYGAYLFSFAFGKDIRTIPAGELKILSPKRDNIIGFASNENFYHVLMKYADTGIKIIPKNINASCTDFIDYDDTIPLFNPVLSSVVCQLMAYNIAKRNNIPFD